MFLNVCANQYQPLSPLRNDLLLSGRMMDRHKNCDLKHPATYLCLCSSLGCLGTYKPTDAHDMMHMHMYICSTCKCICNHVCM